MDKVVFADLPERIIWSYAEDGKTVIANAKHADRWIDDYPREYEQYLAEKAAAD